MTILVTKITFIKPWSNPINPPFCSIFFRAPKKISRAHFWGQGTSLKSTALQRIYTRKVFQRCNLSFSSYADRLTKIKLESLYSRRIKNDLILVYKIIHNLIDVEFANFFQFSHFGNHSLRRHSQNLSRQNISKTTCRRNFFSHRVVHHWNQLSQTLISSPSLSSFKFGLRSMTFDM